MHNVWEMCAKKYHILNVWADPLLNGNLIILLFWNVTHFEFFIARIPFYHSISDREIMVTYSIYFKQTIRNVCGFVLNSICGQNIFIYDVFVIKKKRRRLKVQIMLQLFWKQFTSWTFRWSHATFTRYTTMFDIINTRSVVWRLSPEVTSRFHSLLVYSWTGN